MVGFKGFISSMATQQGMIAIGIATIICGIIILLGRKFGKPLTTEGVLAIGIGAALYAALSVIVIPIGSNTSFRIAIALLTIFGAFFGPTVGFLVGFVGHALNDAFVCGNVYWSWVFMSAMLGFFAGFVRMDKKFDPMIGNCNKLNVLSLYIWSLIGMFAGSILAYFGDVYMYGESPQKLFIQITLANTANLAVIFVVGIPAIAWIARARSKHKDLVKDKDDLN